MKYVVKPAPGRVAVKLAEVDKITAGGIIIPDTHRASATQGIVFASCAAYELEGEEYQPLYPVGTIVIFGEYTGTRISIGRDTVIVLKERDITAILELVPDDVDQPSVTVPTLVKVNDS